jgi:hypothetical protein
VKGEGEGVGVEVGGYIHITSADPQGQYEGKIELN